MTTTQSRPEIVIVSTQIINPADLLPHSDVEPMETIDTQPVDFVTEVEAFRTRMSTYGRNIKDSGQAISINDVVARYYFELCSALASKARYRSDAQKLRKQQLIVALIAFLAGIAFAAGPTIVVTAAVPAAVILLVIMLCARFYRR